MKKHESTIRMKPKIESSLSVLASSIALLLLLLSLAPASAQQSGPFRYEVRGNEVTIIEYLDDNASNVDIPPEIGGRPVTSIASFAFNWSRNLTSVAIPDSVTSIGESAFSTCSSLTSITIPDSVTSIGNMAFSRCSSLTAVTIPASITSIGGSTFYGCSSLTSITIPNSVTSIGGGAFGSCSSLTSITIPNRVTSIGGSAFSGCSSLTSITIPNSVTSIGGFAFSGCSGLVSVTIPDSVTSIGEAPFAYCTSLQEILVDDMNPAYEDHDGILYALGRSVMHQFPAGRSGDFTIPEGVTAVIRYAFSGSIINRITIPDSWSSIGESAFRSSKGLVSVIISESVTSIGDAAFLGCDNLTTVTMPDSVTTIGNFAFRDCPSLTSMPVGRGVTTIGDYTFAECTGLTSVTIPNSVTSIGNYAFQDCTSLARVTIGNGVTNIGIFGFQRCYGLISVVFLGDAPSDLGILTFPILTLPDTPSSDLTIYYLSGSTGFLSPTMFDYPTQELDLAATPAAPWLLEHDFPHDASLHQDLNGDGVNLLMAYALNLDPTKNLQRSLPQPVVENSYLALTFHPARAGLTYTVETSTDLENWTTTGVTRSEPNLDGLVTASVERDVPSRFLRLVVSE